MAIIQDHEDGIKLDLPPEVADAKESHVISGNIFASKKITHGSKNFKSTPDFTHLKSKLRGERKEPQKSLRRNNVQSYGRRMYQKEVCDAPCKTLSDKRSTYQKKQYEQKEYVRTVKEPKHIRNQNGTTTPIRLPTTDKNHREITPNVNNTIVRGCILKAQHLNDITISGDCTCSFFTKVLFFQAESKKDPLLHCRRVIHETTVQSSRNPNWNSSFLSHLSKGHKLNGTGFLQFCVYCINDTTNQRVFIGQNTVKVNDSVGQGRAKWLSLYKWDGTTKVNGEIEIITEVFLPNFV